MAEKTFGFERFREHVRPYTPEWAEKETDIPARDIRRMARGGHGYSLSDIRFLRRLCAIHEHIEIEEVPAASQRELVQQLVDLLAEVEATERRMRQREQELLDEISRLRRRLAEQRPQRW